MVRLHIGLILLKKMLCYNRFVTKKYKKRKPTDIIRFGKKIKISKEAFL